MAFDISVFVEDPSDTKSAASAAVYPSAVFTSVSVRDIEPVRVLNESTPVLDTVNVFPASL